MILEPSKEEFIHKFLTNFTNIQGRAQDLDRRFRKADKYSTGMGYSFSDNGTDNLLLKLHSLYTIFRNEAEQFNELSHKYGLFFTEIKTRTDREYSSKDFTEIIEEILYYSGSTAKNLTSYLPKLSETQFKGVEVLKKSIQNLEISQPLLYRHLNEALNELDEATLIGPALIAGKVIVSVSDQIKLDESGERALASVKNDQTLSKGEKSKRLKETLDKEKVRILVEGSFIKREESEKFITSMRKIRNLYSHKLDFFPNSVAESLQYISEAVRLASIFAEWKETNKI